MRYTWTVCLIALVILSYPLPTYGILREWDDEGATQNWSEEANWTDDGVPDTTDDANIGSLPEAFDDSVLFDVNADLVRTLILQNGADLDTNGGRLVMTVTGSVGEGDGSGTTISELVVRKRNAIGAAAFAIDANSLAIGANGQLNLIDGGQIELDGTGPQPGVLSIADGGTVRGYGWIELSDTDVSLGSLSNLIDNNGTIVVEDPLFDADGEPTPTTLQITASNAPLFAQLNLAGNDQTGQVEVTRNATLMLDPVFLGANELSLAANAKVVMLNGGSIGAGQLLEVNSGILNFGEANELPAVPAVISGNGTLTVSGTIRLNLVAEELIIETPLDALEGLITNRGTVRLRGGGNLRAIEIDDLDLGELVNESTDALSFQGGQSYETSLSNAGLLSVESFEEEATVGFKSFSQSPEGTLALDLSGEEAGKFETLSISNDVELDGTLQISLADMFEPELGTMFTILETQTGSIAGQFASTEFPQFAGRTFDVIYNPTSVELEVIPFDGSLEGDFDMDGDVDGTDFLLWQQGGSPSSLSAADLAEWQGAYPVPPPSEIAAAIVPEPSMWSLLGLAIGACGLLRWN